MLSLPQGFLCYGIEASIKHAHKKDVGIILSQTPATYAGVFTNNKVHAAPVKVCRSLLKKEIQAVIVNSGNANACTGKQGEQDALSIIQKAKEVFKIDKAHALSLSTGVIGVPLPLDKILTAMQNHHQGEKTPQAFAQAIMTTDTQPKALSKTVVIQGKPVTLTGFAKGAGMIAPNMATMLGFVLTDAHVKQNTLQKMVVKNTQKTFNAITIDGDMSTNDSFIVLANKKSQVKIQGKESKDLFEKALFEIMEELAKKIVQDGEGATKLVEIWVEGAKNKKDAQKVGITIANSLLVKTAFFGNDPNWGRILAAAGRSGAKIKENLVELFYLDQFIFKQGQPVAFDKKELAKKLQNTKEILIKINLNQGKIKKRFFTCDLSYDYVKINAEYTT